MAETSASISFVVRRGGSKVAEFTFDRPIINVGKLSTSNLRLEDVNVSRKHAVIERRENGEWRITDLGSTNGTYLNDKRVVQATIKDGDVLRMGESEITVSTSAQPAAAPGAEGAAAPAGAPTGARRGRRSAAKPKGPAGEVRGLGKDSFYAKRDAGDGAQRRVLEVALLWGETILSIQQFDEPTVVTIGHEPGCRFNVPSEVLGRTAFNLIEPRDGGFALNLANPSIEGDLMADGKVRSLKELREEAAGGFHPITPGAKARLRLGEFTLLVSYSPMPERPKASPLQSMDLTPLIFLVLSLILHSSFLIVIGMLPEEQLKSRLDPAARRAKLFKVIKMTEEEEKKKEEEEKKEEDEDKKKKADKESDDLVVSDSVTEQPEQENKIDQLKNKLVRRSTPSKQLANLDSKERRKKAREIAATAGAAKVLTESSLLNSILENDSNPLTMDGKRIIALGSTGDQATAFASGDLDPFGGGTLDGGGGFVGSASVGGPGGPGGGPGGGLVRGLGKDPRGVRNIHMNSKAMKPVAIASSARVSGQLDRATVQRIIRRNLSGIRWCYQDALQRNAKLRGKVTLAFTILPTGKVASPSAKNSSLKDPGLIACITRKMGRWRFPAPKNGGIVKVSYPLLLKTR